MGVTGLLLLLLLLDTATGSVGTGSSDSTAAIVGVRIVADKDAVLFIPVGNDVVVVVAVEVTEAADDDALERDDTSD